MEFVSSNNLYTYHIKDEYFQKMGQNLGLMSNKENGRFRPNYYAVKDKNSDIIWMIPLSSRYDKYIGIYNDKMRKYGKCFNFVINRYGGKDSVFLLQNMFPILPKYIDHIHTANGQPLEVHESIRDEINKKFKRIMELEKRGKKILFTKVDILHSKMIQEYNDECINQEVVSEDVEKENNK
ncbi:type III toxin-antitoxin system CptIN family toxin [Clostridium perfringens]|uniref:type III toxin-antitoxin system CptIN family toxin n=1 Tax=Clostridium perfringens TaxID=1502 RepID=UPI002A4CA70F|nr:hypothetical protein [Clostridium perfringens]MDK0767053.1 hypothetical protein [Clostridium perfringens]